MEVFKTQRRILGNLTHNHMKKQANRLSTAFQELSTIKLATLRKSKDALYEKSDLGGKRGDIKYIERNDKQYFWQFNGEFWADELGDYVFALGSRC